MGGGSCEIVGNHGQRRVPFAGGGVHREQGAVPDAAVLSEGAHVGPRTAEAGRRGFCGVLYVNGGDTHAAICVKVFNESSRHICYTSNITWT